MTFCWTWVCFYLLEWIVQQNYLHARNTRLTFQTWFPRAPRNDFVGVTWLWRNKHYHGSCSAWHWWTIVMMSRVTRDIACRRQTTAAVDALCHLLWKDFLFEHTGDNYSKHISSLMPNAMQRFAMQSPCPRILFYLWMTTAKTPAAIFKIHKRSTAFECVCVCVWRGRGWTLNFSDPWSWPPYFISILRDPSRIRRFPKIFSLGIDKELGQAGLVLFT